MHQWVLEGHFGPIIKIISNKELMDKGLAADLTVKAIVLKYPAIDCATVAFMKYQDELLWLIRDQRRNNFIVNLALTQPKNTLILVERIEHAKNLYQLLLQQKPDRPLYLVWGGTEAEDREAIRQLVEQHPNCDIVASYGVFQTGTSIRNIHYMILASPSKSKIRVLQSIGRGQRISETKTESTVYDITDDLRCNGLPNYTLEHYVERIRLYQREQFRVKIYNVTLGES
jgi:superfamily II DNA or RNA helicase